MTISEETPFALEPGGSASIVKRPRRQGFRGRRPITYGLLVIAVVATLMPFVWMLLGSLKTDGEILRDPSGFLPKDPTLNNYATWFNDLNISTFFLNSLIVAVFTVLGNLLFCSMIGYALAKMEFAGKRALFLLVMLTLMVPGVVTFVPLFVLVSKLGLLNTYPALILPFLTSPLGVFLMRQFMMGIPDSLIEAARIDGAGELRIFFRVVMPLCGPPHTPRGAASWNQAVTPATATTGTARTWRCSPMPG